MNSIKVRIVGIYWSSDVTLNDGQTVWDATKAAELGSNGKLLLTGSGTIQEALHKVDTPITQTPTIPPRQPRPTGIYRIFAERGNPKQASIWQYYINRKVRLADGSEVYTTVSIDNKAVPATLAKVQDGDLIVWRLLRIALTPEGESSESRLA